jgi:hypothetical protein
MACCLDPGVTFGCLGVCVDPWCTSAVVDFSCICPTNTMIDQWEVWCTCQVQIRFRIPELLPLPLS